MRLKDIQDNLKKLLQISFSYSDDFLEVNDDFELVLSAKIMAADLLRDENPKQILMDAFIQLILVASVLNIDLEKELESILMKYGNHSNIKGS